MGKGGNFFHRFTFQRQLAEEIGLAGGRNCFVHELFDRETDLFFGQMVRGDEFVAQFFQHTRSLESRVCVSQAANESAGAKVLNEIAVDPRRHKRCCQMALNDLWG
jgi:hypothetical protein